MFSEGQIFQFQFEIGPEIHAGFVELFKDRNPMHTDPEFAAKHGFPKIVMHGNILNGLLSYFIGEGLPTKNVMIIGQSIHFHRPFFIGDNLTLVAKVETISESVGVVDFAFQFKNSENQRIAKGNIQIKELRK